ncbi:MAG TPA: DUF2726 domain-containing protein [Aquabacterium sp.]|nr:DUF2726 domain-containing protein [Aquabacterium sp.]
MDVIATWPLMVASIFGSLGLGAAWWFRQQALANSGKKSRGKHRSHEEALDTLASWEPMATRVLTAAERDAYLVLRKALPEHIILAQVPLARFVKVPTRNSYSEWLRRAGSLCADLVVCDAASQVIAVVEVRQPVSREKERTLRRHSRMDRVLTAAHIPVHVWVEGALPGPAIAREAVLGAAVSTVTHSKQLDSDAARRSAEAASVVASMQAPSKPTVVRSTPLAAVNSAAAAASAPKGPQKVVVPYAMPPSEATAQVDFNLDDWVDPPELMMDERKDPPPSTWFDELDSSPVPLEAHGGR